MIPHIKGRFINLDNPDLNLIKIKIWVSEYPEYSGNRI